MIHLIKGLLDSEDTFSKKLNFTPHGGLPLIAVGEFYPAVLCVRFAHFAPLRLLCSAKYDKTRQKLYNQPS
jgi:hypothetical protein